MGKNKKRLILLLVLLAPAALMAGGKFPYMFLYLSVLIFLIPYVLLRRSLSQLSGEVLLSDNRREVGQILEIQYSIMNSDTGRFPYLELADLTDDFSLLPMTKEIISIRPGENVLIKREMKCTRRGKYYLGALKVKTGDPFGFFQLEKSLTAGETLIVYPRLRMYPGISLSPHQLPGEGLLKNAVYENYSRISDLREWRDGDSIRRIHWKQTARQDKLIVKNYEHKGDTVVSIFIDMYGHNYRNDRSHLLEDLAIEAASSFVYTSLMESLPVSVYCDMAEKSPIRGKDFRDLTSIMDQLVTLEPKSREKFSASVYNQSYYLPRKSTLYILSPSLDLHDAAVYLSLKQRGFFLVLFLPAFNSHDVETLEMTNKLRKAGIAVNVLLTGREAEAG